MSSMNRRDFMTRLGLGALAAEAGATLPMTFIDTRASLPCDALPTPADFDGGMLFLKTGAGDIRVEAPLPMQAGEWFTVSQTGHAATGLLVSADERYRVRFMVGRDLSIDDPYLTAGQYLRFTSFTLKTS